MAKCNSAKQSGAPTPEVEAGRDVYLDSTVNQEIHVHLPQHAQAGSTGRTGLVGVPALPGHYVARQAELERLKQELLVEAAATESGGRARPVLLQGMPGSGKSVIAAALAREPDVLERFADGIFWLVVGREPNLSAVQGQLAAWLGGPSTFADTRAGRSELEQLLAGKCSLLIATRRGVEEETREGE